MNLNGVQVVGGSNPLAPTKLLTSKLTSKSPNTLRVADRTRFVSPIEHALYHRYMLCLPATVGLGVQQFENTAQFLADNKFSFY